ncbi:MAG: C39 family peptidase, partial [Planctomycetales bacterium]
MIRKLPWLLFVLALVVILLVPISSHLAAKDDSSLDRILIEGVPHIRQRPDFCGEACAAMALQKLGFRYDQDDVFDHSGLAPSDARGCYTSELRSALAKIGFDTGQSWYSIKVDQAAKELQKQWQAIVTDLQAGIPTIICTRYDEQPDTTEHFRLILGYDSKTDEVIYHEPAKRKGAYLKMPRTTMLSLWPLKYRDDTWTVVRLPLTPQDIQPRDARSSQFTKADYTQHMMRLKKKIPGKQFH